MTYTIVDLLKEISRYERDTLIKEESPLRPLIYCTQSSVLLPLGCGKTNPVIEKCLLTVIFPKTTEKPQ